MGSSCFKCCAVAKQSSECQNGKVTYHKILLIGDALVDQLHESIDCVIVQLSKRQVLRQQLKGQCSYQRVVGRQQWNEETHCEVLKFRFEELILQHLLPNGRQHTNHYLLLRVGSRGLQHSSRILYHTQHLRFPSKAQCIRDTLHQV